MFDYLQQFNKLPKELRERVSSPAVMEILTALENKYGLSLAMVVMQVMVKQILIKDLPAYFITEAGLAPEKAQALSRDLQEKIFFTVAAYLGLKTAVVLSPEDKELQILMKDSGIVLPSLEMTARCRQILLTYRKGIRTKIDTRAALERSTSQGGLGLDPATAERLLHVLDRPSIVEPAVAASPKVSAAITELINKNEASSYDLKSALASGQVKPPAVLAEKFKPQPPKLNPSRELEAPDQELSLEGPDKVLEISEKSTPDRVPPVPVVSAKIFVPPVSVAVPTVSEMVPPVVPTASPSPSIEPKPMPVDPLAVLKPEAALNNSFKKIPLDKAGIWSKLFKGKTPPANVPAADPAASSRHLEELVKEAAEKAAPLVRPAASSDARQKMEDVRLRPKVMGPLEELRFLDLVNFRRLGASPKEITDKLVMKIKLLEKDGYDRMIEGVKSWRQSPVNRIYVRLAQEAVAKGVTLREVVAARQAENKETLTMAEIEAIVAMNSRLMF